MRATVLGLSVWGLTIGFLPAMASAQFNTTGTLSQNTSTAQTQRSSPTTTGTPATIGTPTTTTTPNTVTTPTTTPTETTDPTATVVGIPRDAAIVVCAEEFSTGTSRLVVSTASANAGGPSIPAGTPCAQALSDLLAVGFGVIDVLPLAQRVQYTLVR